MREFRQFVRGWVRENLEPMGSVYDFEDWLGTTSYNEARKDQLRAVHDQWFGHGGLPTSRKVRRKLLSCVKSFVKSESYPEYKNCRLINARADIAKVFFGPIIKSMEEVVYKLAPFIKHVPLPERPELLRKLKKAGCRYLESDHTAFEAHFTVEIMRVVEFEVTRWLLRSMPRLEMLLEETESGTNDCYVKSADIRVLLRGFRCSGDMWTSLFNGLGNWLSIAFACHKLGSKLEGYVEGDDGIFAIQGAVPTKAFMEKLGFEVKYVEHDDPATASFCGMILAGDQIIRDPSKFFMNFGWSDRFLGAGHKVKNQLTLAKALSALYETPNCPIVAAAARFVYDRTKGERPRFVEGAYRTVPSDFHPPPTQISEETRELFSLKFGIAPSAQCLMEERVMSGDWSCLAALPFHPHVRDYGVRYTEVC